MTATPRAIELIQAITTTAGQPGSQIFLCPPSERIIMHVAESIDELHAAILAAQLDAQPGWYMPSIPAPSGVPSEPSDWSSPITSDQSGTIQTSNQN